MPETSDRPPLPTRTGLPAFAAGAVLLWVLAEFALRRGLVPLLAEPLGSGTGADAAVLALGFPAIAAVVAWWGLRNGVTRRDWDYDRSPRSLGAGVAGFAGYVVLVAAAAFVYASLPGVEGSAESAGPGVAGAPAWALALLFVGNGLVVPVTEELAWRGVVQTALAESWGTSPAVVATALAFVAKHLVVDLSAPLFRVTSLLVLAFVLCGLRARYGTASSTVAHLGANAVGTGALVLA